MKLVYLVTLCSLLLCSCKFNPSVTSNKRKYRKGHYIPLREEVASNGSSAEKQPYNLQNKKKPKHEQKHQESIDQPITNESNQEVHPTPIAEDHIEFKENKSQNINKEHTQKEQTQTVQDDSLSNLRQSKFRHQANSIPKFTKIPLTFHTLGLLALLGGAILVIYSSSVYLGLLVMAVAALFGLGSTILSVIGLSIEKIRMHSVTTVLLHSIIILLFLVLMPLMILFIMTTVY